MNNWEQFQKMFLAQFKLTFREKQAWFWGIFYPVILMCIFMVIFAGDSEKKFETEVAIVNSNPNPTSDRLFTQLNELSVMKIKTGEPVSIEKARKWVKDQKVDAAIILPESTNSHSVLLLVNKEDEQAVTTQAVSAILDKFVQRTNLSAVGATPAFELKYETLSAGNSDLEYTDFLLTGMIALAISQGGMFGMVGLVDMQRKGLIKRLRMTPAKMSIFGMSDIAMRVLFSLIQIILLSLIGVFIFGANLYINFLSLFVIFLIGAISFSAMGYLFSSFSKTTEAYMGVANIASFLMMFLSGVFFPVETMPDWIQPISAILPLTYFTDGLRDSMVYDTSILSGGIWVGIGIVVTWGLVSYILGSWFYKRKSIISTR